MKRALVLSGGGAKGSYQLGVYKALRKLKIKIDIITGSSIGAINGAFFVSGDYKKAKKLWLTVKTDNLLNYDLGNSKTYKKAFLELVTNKGLKFDKGEKFLESMLSEEKIRNSKIDYGLVTVNLKTRVPKMIRKESIPKGKLISYIIASATCFPAIEMKEIDGDYYVDGGYYDNLPINLAIEMGADEVIAIDLDALGFKKKALDKDIKIDYIKIKNKRKFSLNFDPYNASKNIRLGYNDTMKYYGKLDGDFYTFKKGNLDKNYNLISEKYIELINNNLSSSKKSVVVTELIKNKKYENLLLNIKQGKKIDKEVNDSLEYLGKLFDIDEDKIYDIDYFNKRLIHESENLGYITIDKKLKGKMLIGYVYNQYLKSNNKEDVFRKLSNIAFIFQKDFLASLYLIAITEYYKDKKNNRGFFNKIFSFKKNNVK